MSNIYDLLGVGIGPFNLSLAALASGLPELRTLFAERNPDFSWHPELLFADADMQTTYLKDLVTPVDPTNPHSFLNYLVQHKLFYSFLNTSRTVITRQEFQAYCRWVSSNLSVARFDDPVLAIETHAEAGFRVHLQSGPVLSQSICIGTGMQKRIPDLAIPHLGPRCFHAKSPELKTMNLRDKRVLIIGGGQTGCEIFLNALRGHWGKVQSLVMISRRQTLEALDESAFVNEYFTPEYAEAFYSLPDSVKEKLVAHQKLASDGITPAYAQTIYRELYLDRQFQGQKVELHCSRELLAMEEQGDEFRIDARHLLRGSVESCYADIVILATGFKNELPRCMEGLMNRIDCDSSGRLRLAENYTIPWDGPANARIYAVNFGRHSHGIAEPQTSLMAWRSARILNDVLGRQHFSTEGAARSWIMP